MSRIMLILELRGLHECIVKLVGADPRRQSFTDHHASQKQTRTKPAVKDSKALHSRAPWLKLWPLGAN